VRTWDAIDVRADLTLLRRVLTGGTNIDAIVVRGQDIVPLRAEVLLLRRTVQEEMVGTGGARARRGQEGPEGARARSTLWRLGRTLDGVNSSSISDSLPRVTGTTLQTDGGIIQHRGAIHRHRGVSQQHHGAIHHRGVLGGQLLLVISKKRVSTAD
jgi:hypothetical protein